MSQCTPLQNSSILHNFYLRTDETLYISDDGIFAIIKNLNPNKSHGWDNISIRIIKLCGKSIVFPLKLIFEASLQVGEFPDYWKNNGVPVHKKESKNLVKNYRQISLLPIFRKIFERVIFKDLFNYLHREELCTKCQSGFFFLKWPLNHLAKRVRDMTRTCSQYYLLFMIATLDLTVILRMMLGVYF